MKKSKNHIRGFKVLSVFAFFLHLCIVILFFSSPFLPFWWQITFLVLGVVTLPLRILFFEGKCPFTGWERYCRREAGDMKAKIHTHTFMEAYFGMPDAVFKKVEKSIMGLLVITILFYIFMGQSLWQWCFTALVQT